MSDSDVDMLLARVHAWQLYRKRYQTPEMHDLIALAYEYENLKAERDAAVKALQDIARQPEGDEQSAQAVAREAFKIIDAARGGA